MKEIVIATSNPGKLEEFKEMLKDMEVELHYLAEWPGIEAPEENGRTFAANARLAGRKRAYFCRQCAFKSNVLCQGNRHDLHCRRQRT